MVRTGISRRALIVNTGMAGSVASILVAGAARAVPDDKRVTAVQALAKLKAGIGSGAIRSRSCSGPSATAS